ncbi:MAG: protein-export chaperone SecB [Thermotogae bacterium]|nr:protein-export chaperone SecB [Thermotogota bacterium]MCL5033219.1 protein-export chaperone SecB [Thermotogota bacterium]
MSNGENYLSQLKITSISIYKASFEIKKLIPNNQQLEIQVALKPNINISKSENTSDNQTSIVDLNISVNLKNKDISFVEVNLSINGSFIGENMNEQQFIKLVKFSGVSNLIQISRSYIISMTSQLGIIPPIVLPMINLEELYKNT